jgi:hypothetical protein
MASETLTDVAEVLLKEQTRHGTARYDDLFGGLRKQVVQARALIEGFYLDEIADEED